MKQLKKLSWFFIVATVLLTSCQMEDSLTGNSRAENPLVTEAREFFENAITEAATRGTLDQHKGWNPGEVTPQWEKAAFKQDVTYHYVFVPIHTQYQYMARETAMRDSIERIYHVPVSQLLCIRKRSDGVQSAAYLTLIPSKGYYSTNKNSVVEKYIKNETFHGNLTGQVLYNDLVTFDLLAVDKVIDGEYEWGFSRRSVPSEHSFWRNYRKMFKNISVFAVAKTRMDDDHEMDPIEVIYCERCFRRNCICDNDWGDDQSDNPDNDKPNNDNDSEDTDWGNPTYPTYPSYPGGGGSSSGGSSSGSNNENDEQKKQEEKYKELGEEAVHKVIDDLENGKAEVNLLNPQTQALLKAADMGLNTNGIITSCLNFMNQLDVGKLASSYGRGISLAGLGVGLAQSAIIVIEGNYTTGNILTLVSTGLAAAGYGFYLFGNFPVAGVLGVSAGVVGIVSAFFNQDLPSEIHLELEGGGAIRIYLV